MSESTSPRVTKTQPGVEAMKQRGGDEERDTVAQSGVDVSNMKEFSRLGHGSVPFVDSSPTREKLLSQREEQQSRQSNKHTAITATVAAAAAPSAPPPPLWRTLPRVGNRAELCLATSHSCYAPPQGPTFVPRSSLQLSDPNYFVGGGNVLQHRQEEEWYSSGTAFLAGVACRGGGGGGGGGGSGSCDSGNGRAGALGLFLGYGGAASSALELRKGMDSEERWGRDLWVRTREGSVFLRFEEIELFEAFFRILCPDLSPYQDMDDDDDDEEEEEEGEADNCDDRLPRDTAESARGKRSNTVGEHSRTSGPLLPLAAARAFLERADLNQTHLETILATVAIGVGSSNNTNGSGGGGAGNGNSSRGVGQKKRSGSFGGSCRDSRNRSDSTGNSGGGGFGDGAESQQPRQQQSQQQSNRSKFVSRPGWLVACKLVGLAQRPPPKEALAAFAANQAAAAVSGSAGGAGAGGNGSTKTGGGGGGGFASSLPMPHPWPSLPFLVKLGEDEAAAVAAGMHVAAATAAHRNPPLAMTGRGATAATTSSSTNQTAKNNHIDNTSASAAAAAVGAGAGGAAGWAPSATAPSAKSVSLHREAWAERVEKRERRRWKRREWAVSLPDFGVAVGPCRALPPRPPRSVSLECQLERVLESKESGDAKGLRGGGGGGSGVVVVGAVAPLHSSPASLPVSSKRARPKEKQQPPPSHVAPGDEAAGGGAAAVGSTPYSPAHCNGNTNSANTSPQHQHHHHSQQQHSSPAPFTSGLAASEDGAGAGFTGFGALDDSLGESGTFVMQQRPLPQPRFLGGQHQQQEQTHGGHRPSSSKRYPPQAGGGVVGSFHPGATTATTTMVTDASTARGGDRLRAMASMLEVRVHSPKLVASTTLSSGVDEQGSRLVNWSAVVKETEEGAHRVEGHFGCGGSREQGGGSGGGGLTARLRNTLSELKDSAASQAQGSSSGGGGGVFSHIGGSVAAAVSATSAVAASLAAQTSSSSPASSSPSSSSSPQSGNSCGGADGRLYSHYTQYTLFTRTELPWYPRRDIGGVHRRFSDFVWLHERLKLVYPGALLPPLPPKRMWNKNDENFVKERLEWLNHYCRHLAQHPRLWTSFEVEAMLCASPQGLAAAKAVMPAGGQGGLAAQPQPLPPATVSAPVPAAASAAASTGTVGQSAVVLSEEQRLAASRKVSEHATQMLSAPAPRDGSSRKDGNDRNDPSLGAPLKGGERGGSTSSATTHAAAAAGGGSGQGANAEAAKNSIGTGSSGGGRGGGGSKGAHLLSADGLSSGVRSLWAVSSGVASGVHKTGAAVVQAVGKQARINEWLLQHGGSGAYSSSSLPIQSLADELFESLALVRLSQAQTLEQALDKSEKLHATKRTQAFVASSLGLALRNAAETLRALADKERERRAVRIKTKANDDGLRPFQASKQQGSRDRQTEATAAAAAAVAPVNNKKASLVLWSPDDDDDAADDAADGGGGAKSLFPSRPSSPLSPESTATAAAFTARRSFGFYVTGDCLVRSLAPASTSSPSSFSPSPLKGVESTDSSEYASANCLEALGGTGFEAFFSRRIERLNTEFDSVVQLKFLKGLFEGEASVVRARAAAKEELLEAAREVDRAAERARMARAASMVGPTSLAVESAEAWAAEAGARQRAATTRLQAISEEFRGECIRSDALRLVDLKEALLLYAQSQRSQAKGAAAAFESALEVLSPSDAERKTSLSRIHYYDVATTAASSAGHPSPPAAATTSSSVPVHQRPRRTSRDSDDARANSNSKSGHGGGCHGGGGVGSGVAAMAAAAAGAVKQRGGLVAGRAKGVAQEALQTKVGRKVSSLVAEMSGGSGGGVSGANGSFGGSGVSVAEDTGGYTGDDSDLDWDDDEEGSADDGGGGGVCIVQVKPGEDGEYGDGKGGEAGGTGGQVVLEAAGGESSMFFNQSQEQQQQQQQRAPQLQRSQQLGQQQQELQQEPIKQTGENPASSQSEATATTKRASYPAPHVDRHHTRGRQQEGAALMQSILVFDEDPST